VAGYCKSCFRDLPSEDAACRACASVTARPSPLLGVLLFGVVMAGMLSFDSRLIIGAAALAIVAIGIQIARAVRR